MHASQVVHVFGFPARLHFWHKLGRNVVGTLLAPALRLTPLFTGASAFPIGVAYLPELNGHCLDAVQNWHIYGISDVSA